MEGRHIAIPVWLEALKLTEYVSFFGQYSGVEKLLYISEAEIKELGIKNSAHRAKILSSLRVLKEKYEKGHYQAPSHSQSTQQRAPRPIYTSPPNVPPGFSVPDYQHVVTSPGPHLAHYTRDFPVGGGTGTGSSASELKNQSWYHGWITRQDAETLLKNDGDFLVRDCISKPGDFVLSCKWGGSALSFMINSIVESTIKGQPPTVYYQFEEDSFPTISQLIKFYKVHRKPVTVASGAVLENPVPRAPPIEVPIKSPPSANPPNPYQDSLRYSQRPASPNRSSHPPADDGSTGSPSMNRKWAGSQPALNVSSASDLLRTNTMLESRSSSLDRLDSLPEINVIAPTDEHLKHPSTSGGRLSPRPLIAHHVRSGSAPILLPELETLKAYKDNAEATKFNSLGRRTLTSSSSENDLSQPPPPKPSRIPSIKYRLKPTVVVRKIQVDDDDRDYSDYGQVKEDPSWLKNGRAPSAMFTTTTKPPETSSVGGRRAQRMKGQQGKGGPGVAATPPGGSPLGTSPQTQPPHSSSPNSGSPYSSSPSGRANDMRPLPAAPTPPGQNTQIDAITQGLRPVGKSNVYFRWRGKVEDEDDYDNNFGNSNQSDGSEPPSPETPKDNRTDSSPAQGTILFNSNLNSNFHYGHSVDNHQLRSRPTISLPKESRTTICGGAFKTPFLPTGHKVLDQTVLINVKNKLLACTHRTVALHITQYDLQLLQIHEDKDHGLGVVSSFELLTLPQGRQLRDDLVERWECLRLFVLVTLMTSQTVTERARLLSLWIQTCLELKALGNLYSIGAVLAGLTAPQMERLTDTWMILRQNHTSSAYMFDTKLKPLFVSLNDGSSNLPLDNICIPYVTPVCRLLELVEDTLHEHLFWERDLDPIATALDVLLVHLDTARVIASEGKLYHVTGAAILNSLTLDPELVQILRPEFSLLLFWGENGMGVPRRFRLEKLEKVFTVLSNKYQRPGDDGTSLSSSLCMWSLRPTEP